MGYRLNVQDVGNPKINFYGTKLYGYVKTEDLISYKYLCEIHKAPDIYSWYISSENFIRLTAEEFVKFIDYYETDFNSKAESAQDLMKVVHGYGNLMKMKQTSSDKIVSWG